MKAATCREKLKLQDSELLNPEENTVNFQGGLRENQFFLLWFKADHSSVLAWRIPGTGEPGGLPSMGSHRVGHD